MLEERIIANALIERLEAAIHNSGRVTGNTDRTQIVRVDGESLSENWIPQETSLRRRTILIENQKHRRRKH